LTFSLVMRPLNAIYNYAHELMHVCHRDEARPLWKSMYVKFNSLSRAEKYYYSGAQDAKERGIPNPEFEEIQARILRNNLISELDSFKYQLQSYTEQARTSPGLCEKSETAQYTAMEADWRKGIFAQVTLSGYVAGLDNADARVFDPASALLSYEDKASRTSFQMRTFHPEIVAFINASGIPYFLVGR
jgi:hypothetical protein